MKKLKHPGVKDHTVKRMKSFLTERKKYTKMKTRKSDMKESLVCTEVQGSKVSALLYTIYTKKFC